MLDITLTKKLNNKSNSIFDSETLSEEDIRISELDPLSLDVLISELPLLNSDEGCSIIIEYVKRMNLRELVTENLDRDSAVACLRDLGHIAAFLTRYSISISETLPELEEALILLSKITNEVPRDSVYTYGTRNPAGSRQRKFTQLPEETLFINSFSDGMSGLNSCIEQFLNLQSLSILDPNFIQTLNIARESFTRMIDAIVSVRRAIPPEMFTGILRPYFDPIKLSGIDYLAPGGAQMPILLLDLILWSNKWDDDAYLYYLEDNLQYCPQVYRELSKLIREEEGTLIDRLVSEYKQLTDSNELEQAKAVLSTLKEFFNDLIKFRRPHLKVAQENFALRSESDLGSGGYKPDILQMLVSKTEEARSILSNLLSE